MGGIEPALSDSEILIVAGAGGVGKTTIAAALGIAAVESGNKRVLVLTVDPAKRLADALGLVGLSSNANRVDPVELNQAMGHEVPGELYVAMLDAKSSWDELIKRHAPDVATREKILSNPIYKNISSRFVQSHDYIAMESLYELYISNAYDLIVIDTPPSRHAIDFLDAPVKMADFFSSRLLKWLTLPARNRLLMGAFKPFYQIADKILGAQFLSDVADFFLLFQSMYDGFIVRARSVSKILESSTTKFVVVSSPEAAPMQEAEFFISAISQRRLKMAQMVVNRTLPDYFRDPGSIFLAHKLQDNFEQIAKDFLEKGKKLKYVSESELPPGRLEALVERVFLEISGSFLNFSEVALQEAAEISKLAVDEELITLVPHLNFDISDLNSLGKVAAHLSSSSSPFTM